MSSVRMNDGDRSYPYPETPRIEVKVSGIERRDPDDPEQFVQNLARILREAVERRERDADQDADQSD